MQGHIRFWAKTFHAADDAKAASAPACKPVLHHLLDVAAVAKRYLESQPARLAREAAMAGMEPAAYVDFVGFLAGLHDLGKFTRNFQAKVATLWPTEMLGEWPKEQIPGPSHWQATWLLLQADGLKAVFRRFFPVAGEGARAALAAIAGHHGRPPDPDLGDKYVNDALRKGVWLDEPCLAAARAAFDELARLTGAQPASLLDEDMVGIFSWRLSGLVTLADWVGSDADYFGPRPIDTPLDDYWREAQDNARHALRAKGLTPLAAARAPDLATISPRAAAAPRPMQRAAGAVALAAGPQIFVIEDATGSGKTEAAMLLAVRMMAAGLGEGLYFALPTMATANAMHARLAAAGDNLFALENDRRPSIILAHGKARLADELARLEARPAGDGEETAAAVCNAWIADDRRRAFFADIGAGTIDQAFLAVLPKKHLTLRQYALAGRILVIDEAHSFDSYMKEELGGLLRLHAMNGGSAIVLSATLSLKARRQIAEGFYKGIGLRDKQAAACVSMNYPLLTHMTTSGVIESDKEEPGFDVRLARAVAIERIADRAASFECACAAAERGAAVLVICNAVDEAIAAHEALAAMRPAEKTHLFHARFAQGDRIAIEESVLERFGRESSAESRSGHILVATQVVEQSLDLDFDLVISDLAPIDLLIQRAGRLWRHMDVRPAAARQIEGPTMIVVSPDPGNVANADWLNDCLGRAAYTYQHAGVMWRTARTIFSRGAIDAPGDLRPMVEAVYGEQGEPVPDVLQSKAQEGAGKESAAKALGAFNVVNLADGYGALPTNLRSDEDIGTRLGEDTITIRLARRENGALVPWFRSNGGARLDWALSELRVRRKFWGNAATAPEDVALHDAAKRAWTEWEQDICIAEVGGGGLLKLSDADFSYSVSSGLKSCR